MAKKIKDTDYLVISARIKAMETGLLTRERMEQILEARSDDEAIKLLQECGYPELDATNPEALDAALSAAREATLEDLTDGAPDSRYIDIFKLKYDYHNAKVILKARAMGVDAQHMLMDMGRVPAAELKAAMDSGELDSLPTLLAAAVAEARDVLDTTRDPQLSDIALDRRSYQDMTQVAASTGSAFLAGYVRAVIDAVNLRTLVRTLRMGKSAEFLQGVLVEGGEMDPASILAVSAAGGSGLSELYAPTALHGAAEAGAEALLNGGALTAFEKL
ncbi:MAG: V-type ATPase subunit, partial [Oscillibacter sp.]